MSVVPRLYRTWTQALTEIGLCEELDASDLASRVRFAFEADVEAYKKSVRLAEAACIVAGVQPDANGFLPAPNPLLLPVDLPAELDCAYQSLIARDTLRAMQRRASAEFSDRCECAATILIDAAKSGKIAVMAKPSETAFLSTAIPPAEFEFLDWNMSVADDRLQNYEQGFFWRQVTVEEGHFQTLQASRKTSVMDSTIAGAVAASNTGNTSSRRSKVAGDKLRLCRILLALYPEGDPISVSGLNTDIVLEACKERMGKRVSTSTLRRARYDAWPDLI